MNIPFYLADCSVAGSFEIRKNVEWFSSRIAGLNIPVSFPRCCESTQRIVMYVARFHLTVIEKIPRQEVNLL